MPKIRKSIEINAPVSDVFAYLAHPENLPEIWPSMLEVSNVAPNATGGSDFDWVYKLLGMKFRGRSKTTELEPDRLIVVENEEGIRSRFRYEVQGRDDTTIFSQEIEYEIPGSLLGRFAAPFIERLNEREAQLVTENLKARLEHGVAARPEAEQPVP